jgi:hypothetical protein
VVEGDFGGADGGGLLVGLGIGTEGLVDLGSGWAEGYLVGEVVGEPKRTLSWLLMIK